MCLTIDCKIDCCWQSSCTYPAHTDGSVIKASAEKIDAHCCVQFLVNLCGVPLECLPLRVYVYVPPRKSSFTILSLPLQRTSPDLIVKRHVRDYTDKHYLPSNLLTMRALDKTMQHLVSRLFFLLIQWLLFSIILAALHNFSKS